MYKVLIIDDEVFIREGMKQIIPWQELGCKVIGEAQNGEEGMDKIIQMMPDIIISDIRMPRKNGLEMIDEMKSTNKNMQIIILTGFREFEYAQQAIRLGVLRFLLKPSKMDEIKEAITAAVTNLNKLPKVKQALNKVEDSCMEAGDLDDKLEITSDDGEKPQYLVRQAVEYINE